MNMFNDIAEFGFPTSILFGSGALKRVAHFLTERKSFMPLIVTDAGLISTAAFEQAVDVFTKAGIVFQIFSHISPNPMDTEIEAAATYFEDKQCDSIIGLGGGSAMDAAKALAVLVVNQGRMADFDASIKGKKMIQGPLPALICIPTTSGTGSEVGRCAVISSAQNSRKFMVCHPLMMPDLAVLDPDLTVGLPGFLTAATGMDAFSHCLESLVSPVFHPMCDAIALQGIELVVKYLETACNHPKNLEARGYMQLASMMGAVAFQKDLGATHAIAHALSAVCGMHHGLANAICMAPVMRYNLETSQKKYAKMAAIFGVDTDEMTDMEASEKAVDCVTDLVKRVGLPEKLSRAGVDESQLDALAETAFLDPCHQTNPLPCTKADLLAIIKQAY
jgi:4-hydroxybutyrate dehydrogenase